mmetsp:Transcript_28456/g.92222  ORF Transcript_28456/g.92222 Transcript_28456/m.92222 type:complete len:1002 (-) Transcript_28456:176-3181(-)
MHPLLRLPLGTLLLQHQVRLGRLLLALLVLLARILLRLGACLDQLLALVLLLLLDLAHAVRRVLLRLRAHLVHQRLRLGAQLCQPALVLALGRIQLAARVVQLHLRLRRATARLPVRHRVRHLLHHRAHHFLHLGHHLGLRLGCRLGLGLGLRLRLGGSLRHWLRLRLGRLLLRLALHHRLLLLCRQHDGHHDGERLARDGHGEVHLLLLDQPVEVAAGHGRAHALHRSLRVLGRHLHVEGDDHVHVPLVRAAGAQHAGRRGAAREREGSQQPARSGHGPRLRLPLLALLVHGRRHFGLHRLVLDLLELLAREAVHLDDARHPHAVRLHAQRLGHGASQAPLALRVEVAQLRALQPNGRSHHAHRRVVHAARLVRLHHTVGRIRQVHHHLRASRVRGHQLVHVRLLHHLLRLLHLLGRLRLGRLVLLVRSVGRVLRGLLRALQPAGQLHDLIHALLLLLLLLLHLRRRRGRLLRRRLAHRRRLLRLLRIAGHHHRVGRLDRVAQLLRHRLVQHVLQTHHRALAGLGVLLLVLELLDLAHQLLAALLQRLAACLLLLRQLSLGGGTRGATRGTRGRGHGACLLASSLLHSRVHLLVQLALHALHRRHGRLRRRVGARGARGTRGRRLGRLLRLALLLQKLERLLRLLLRTALDLRHHGRRTRGSGHVRVRHRRVAHHGAHLVQLRVHQVHDLAANLHLLLHLLDGFVQQRQVVLRVGAGAVAVRLQPVQARLGAAELRVALALLPAHALHLLLQLVHRLGRRLLQRHVLGQRLALLRHLLLQRVQVRLVQAHRALVQRTHAGRVLLERGRHLVQQLLQPLPHRRRLAQVHALHAVLGQRARRVLVRRRQLQQHRVHLRRLVLRVRVLRHERLRARDDVAHVVQVLQLLRVSVQRLRMPLLDAVLLVQRSAKRSLRSLVLGVSLRCAVLLQPVHQTVQLALPSIHACSSLTLLRRDASHRPVQSSHLCLERALHPGSLRRSLLQVPAHHDHHLLHIVDDLLRR